MDIKFGESVDVIPEVRDKSRPPLHDVVMIHGMKPTDGQVQIFMDQTAISQVDEHGKTNLGSELGGLLLGYTYQDDGRTCVDVKAAIPAISDEKGPVHFTFTADAWANAHTVRERKYPDFQIIGWFHTHPNLGVFYSSDDVVVHSTAFSLPWHIGLVVDPIRDEACFFGWEQDVITQSLEIEPIRGFYEMGDITPETTVTWRSAYRNSLSEMRRGAVRDSMLSPVIQQGYGLTGGDMLFAIMATALLFILGMSLLTQRLNRRVQVLESISMTLAADRQVNLHNQGIMACGTDATMIVSPSPEAIFSKGETVVFYGIANERFNQDFALQIKQIRNPGVPVHSLFNSEWKTIQAFGPTDGMGEITRWRLLSVQPGRYDMRIVPVTKAVDTGDLLTIDRFACQQIISITR